MYTHACSFPTAKVGRESQAQWELGVSFTCHSGFVAEHRMGKPWSHTTERTATLPPAFPAAPWTRDSSLTNIYRLSNHNSSPDRAISHPKQQSTGQSEEFGQLCDDK